MNNVLSVKVDAEQKCLSVLSVGMERNKKRDVKDIERKRTDVLSG